jgi:hypothetical protein
MGASLSERAQDGMPTCAIRLRRLDDVMHDEASVPIEVLSGDVGAHPHPARNLLRSHGCGVRFVAGPARCLYKACEDRDIGHVVNDGRASEGSPPRAEGGKREES